MSWIFDFLNFCSSTCTSGFLTQFDLKYMHLNFLFASIIFDILTQVELTSQNLICRAVISMRVYNNLLQCIVDYGFWLTLNLMWVEFHDSGHSHRSFSAKNQYPINSNDIIETSAILFHCKSSHAETTKAHIQETETHSTKNELYANKYGVHYSGHNVHRMKSVCLHKESYTFTNWIPLSEAPT